MSNRPLDDILGNDWKQDRREIELGLKELTKQEMFSYLGRHISEREMREARENLDKLRALARHRHAPRD